MDPPRLGLTTSSSPPAPPPPGSTSNLSDTSLDSSCDDCLYSYHLPWSCSAPVAERASKNHPALQSNPRRLRPRPTPAQASSQQTAKQNSSFRPIKIWHVCTMYQVYPGSQAAVKGVLVWCLCTHDPCSVQSETVWMRWPLLLRVADLQARRDERHHELCRLRLSVFVCCITCGLSETWKSSCGRGGGVY